MLDPLYAFVFVGLFSPGPNVIMLTASGAQFGFRRTLPHLSGVVLGVGVIAAFTGLGVGALIQSYPQVEFALKILAAAWIIWMAWRLRFSTYQPKPESGLKPFTIAQAILFQWVNPKLWAVALTASSAYTSGLPPICEALRLAGAFSGVNLIVCLFWSFAGSLLAYLLVRPQIWRVFLRGMALALAATAAMVFI